MEGAHKSDSAKSRDVQTDQQTDKPTDRSIDHVEMMLVTYCKTKSGRFPLSLDKTFVQGFFNLFS